MQNFTQLREKRDTYLATAQNVIGKAVAEQRALTQAEQTDVSGLREKAENIAATIRAGEELRGIMETPLPIPASAATRQAGAGHETRGPFGSLGEQLRSVVQAARPGGQTDPRLFEVRAAAGMSEAVPSDGGFLVQPELAYDLLQQGMKAAKLAPLCRPFPIGENANGVRLPMVHETSRANGQRFGGLQLYWPNEGDSATPSKPKFRMLEMVAKKLVGLIYLTDELLQDVSVLNAYVTQAFRDEFGFVIDDKIFRGTGAGQPLGFLNSNALVTVSPVNAQPADTIITANVLSMYARNSSPTTSLWLANVNALPQLASLSLLIGTAGAPIGLLKDGIATSPTGFTILGRPLIFMEQSASIGDAGDIAFVDPQQYMLASRGGLQTALSMHVRFLTDEGTLRFVYRLDGQPIPAVAVTPYMGTGDTVSPFVILGAR